MPLSLLTFVLKQYMCEHIILDVFHAPTERGDIAGVSVISSLQLTVPGYVIVHLIHLSAILPITIVVLLYKLILIGPIMHFWD